MLISCLLLQRWRVALLRSFTQKVCSKKNKRTLCQVPKVNTVILMVSLFFCSLPNYIKHHFVPSVWTVRYSLYVCALVWSSILHIFFWPVAGTMKFLLMAAERLFILKCETLVRMNFHVKTLLYLRFFFSWFAVNSSGVE